MTRRSKDVRRARPALGTLVEIRLRDTPAAQRALERGFAAVDRVHRLMSRQEAESDVARIARAAPGEPVVIDPWTDEVLRRAKELHTLSGGLFDCTVAPGARSSLGDLQLLGNGVAVALRPIGLTLDGIAKGYAVDRAVEALRAAGAEGGVVNAGGDLRVFGEEAESVHVRHPGSPGQLLFIGEVREAAVASSGRYFSDSALVDPRTMRAHPTRWSATVIAADCTTADALTKPCLLDRPGAERLAAACEARALLVSPRRLPH